MNMHITIKPSRNGSHVIPRYSEGSTPVSSMARSFWSPALKTSLSQGSVHAGNELQTRARIGVRRGSGPSLPVRVASALTIALNILVAFSFHASAAETVPPPPTSHADRIIEGWTVHVDARLLDGPDKELGDRALRILANHLYRITLVVPADKVKRLQQVPIWLDRTHGKLGPAQYHPSAQWLKDNGYDPALAKRVHIPDASNFARSSLQHEQPWMVLHELSHAYHDQVLGFDDPEIKAAWQHFVDSGKYKSVLHMDGKMRPHYGLTNPQEFFAEMSETYFRDEMTSYPFNCVELKPRRAGNLRAACEGVGAVAVMGVYVGRALPAASRNRRAMPALHASSCSFVLPGAFVVKSCLLPRQRVREVTASLGEFFTTKARRREGTRRRRFVSKRRKRRGAFSLQTWVSCRRHD